MAFMACRTPKSPKTSSAVPQDAGRRVSIPHDVQRQSSALLTTAKDSIEGYSPMILEYASKYGERQRRELKKRCTYVLDVLAHARFGDPTATEDLHGVACDVLGRARYVHLQ